MKPLYLDFARERRHRNLLGPALLGTALLAGALLLAWFGALKSELEDAGHREAAFERRGAAVQRALPALLNAEEEKRLAATLRQLTTPWEALLAAVEEAASEDVAVLALEQDAAQSSLKLLAEARNPEAMLGYLRRLEASKALRSATLETHKIDAQQPGQPVRFNVISRYSAPR